MFHPANRNLEMIQRRRDAEKWMSNRCLPELLKEYEMF
jgi:hypothetical protein